MSKEKYIKYPNFNLTLRFVLWISILVKLKNDVNLVSNDPSCVMVNELYPMKDNPKIMEDQLKIAHGSFD